ncbi:MAG: mechanosensitive ion channel family protein [Rhodospirillaceae bacterium]|nr:mechanosensitive ion channel family protein [Rhodospirillaceae bacterium]
MGETVEQVESNLKTLTVLLEKATEFVVAYGFQILGALLFLAIGLKISGWMARRVVDLGARRNFDPTLTRFGGNVVRVLLVGLVIIISLSNFGVTIAPLVALAGAIAFGGTLAIQGPLSNYGAGLAIILTRPFRVGNTIEVQGIYGVVDEITLGYTRLTGEDGEMITVPNKEVVGQVIVNSHESRAVETRIFLSGDQDPAAAIGAVRAVLDETAGDEGFPPPQVGIHDFAYGGVVIGARFWVPSLKYFQRRYTVNEAIHAALDKAGIKAGMADGVAVLAPPLAGNPDRVARS